MNIAAVDANWVGQVVDGKFPLLQWLGGAEHSGVFLTQLPGEQPQKSAIRLIPADAGDAERRMSRLEMARG